MFATNLKFLFLIAVAFLFFILSGCRDSSPTASEAVAVNILFLHHSTGHVVWKGQSNGLGRLFGKSEAVPEWFKEYNKANGTNFKISEQNFPKAQPYGWNNYPYDYYNIWVLNANDESFKEEPTLEKLTGEYDVIIFKHCFPVGNILEDTGNPDPGSSEKRMENYKAQYEAIKEKLHSFPKTKFIVWTASANEKSNVSEAEAKRTKEFVDWVINQWDTSDDNIYLWDFYNLETEGGLFLKDEYAAKSGDSHPSAKFGQRVAPLFGARIVDVINNNGEGTNLKGEPK